MPFDAMYIRRFWFRLLFTFPYFLVCWVIQTYLNLRFNHKAYGVQPDHYVLSQHPMVGGNSNRPSSLTIVRPLI